MARRLSALRPGQRIIALTNSENVQNELALIWGVESLLVPHPDTTEENACGRREDAFVKVELSRTAR